MRNSYKLSDSYSGINAFRRLREEKAEKDKKELSAHKKLLTNTLKDRMSSYMKNKDPNDIYLD